MNADQSPGPEYSIDPFPEIPPALLNSADITRYAREGYLVSDFNEERLKSAAYQMRFLGTLYYWENDQDGLREIKEPICPKRRTRSQKTPSPTFSRRRSFYCLSTSPPESTFVSHSSTKACCWGTGPLVDAGFQGSLLVPLHNLTSNDYTIRGGEPVIWAEFTKLSPHKYWRQDCREDRSTRPKELVRFRPSKSRREASEYLQRLK